MRPKRLPCSKNWSCEYAAQQRYGSGKATLEAINSVYNDLGGGVLGIIPAVVAGGSNGQREAGLIQMLIDMRNQARKSKNFAESDRIRNELAKLGVTLEDRADGTIWRANWPQDRLQRERINTMEGRLPREDILRHLSLEHQRLMDTFARLSPEQWLSAGTVGTWSARDVLAHLVFWNHYATDGLSGSQRHPIFSPSGTDDEINAQAVASFQGWTVEALNSAFEHSYSELISLVEGLPAHAFEPVHGAVRWMKPYTGRWPITPTSIGRSTKRKFANGLRVQH